MCAIGGRAWGDEKLPDFTSTIILILFPGRLTDDLDGGTSHAIVAFRSAKSRFFAERKTTIVAVPNRRFRQLFITPGRAYAGILERGVSVPFGEPWLEVSVKGGRPSARVGCV